MSEKLNNFQIQAYLEKRDVKQHEHEMLERIRHDLTEDFSGRILDIGCATGVFLEMLGETFPKAKLAGLDLSEELLEIAKERLASYSVDLVAASALEFCPQDKFDIIVASGVMNIFEDFVEPMSKWLQWLSDGGRLYIFGPFNSANVDTVIKFRNNYTGGGWEGGLTSYSVKTVETYLSENGWKCDFQKFSLKIDLSPDENPIRNYTVQCADGSVLLANGANVISEYHFLSIWKQ